MRGKIHFAEMKYIILLSSNEFLEHSLINSNAAPKIEKYKWESAISHYKASGEKCQYVIEEFHF